MSGINLLSLDGGGVRGLSSLLVLQNLMHRICPEEDILPCQIFAMIAGTSTGGIIAIMLARLRMKVSDCIAAYHSLSAEIFREPWQPKTWKLSKAVLGTTGLSDKARSQRLRAAICKIIEQHLPPEEKAYWTKPGEAFNAENVPLYPGSYRGSLNCPVFVVTAQQADGKRCLLRSFRSRSEVDLGFTIVEASLATSAAPLVFTPLSKARNGKTEAFVDGGLGSNNPVRLLVQEAHEYCPGFKITALVSLGTGAKPPLQIGKHLAALAKKVAEMATDAAGEAEDFAKYISLRDPSLHAVYFRFDTTNGVGNIALDEWRVLGIISQRTRSWLSDGSTQSQLRKCAALLTPETVRQTERRRLAIQITEHESTSQGTLPELQVKLTRSGADWSNTLVITDPSDGSEFRVTLWRTVRIPEDGKVYELPAGLGTFPLIEAAPFHESLAKEGMKDADIIFPMYDREAMYMEFIPSCYSFGPGYVQRPFAVRPAIGGINAVSGLPIETSLLSTSRGKAETPTKTRVGKRAPNEDLGLVPNANQDYIVAEASLHHIREEPQWLDGIAVATGRVRQFVAVPFGSGESVESQKTGQDSVGGIQLEIIPSLPLHRLRRHLGQRITIYTKSTIIANWQPIVLDAGALVWDYCHAACLQRQIPIRMVRCVFERGTLEMLGRLSDYGIKDQSTIIVIYKIRGGGGFVDPPKRMALGSGGAISQNIERDVQDPAIWDTARAIRLNIQMVNSLAFEQLTGLVAPETPISFDTYQKLGIPFFQYYMEDTQAVSGDFGGVLSLDELSISNSKGNSTSVGNQSWTTTPDACLKCGKRPPYRL